MKKLLLTTFSILLVGYSIAQYKVQFIVTDSAEKKQIYIAGSFNNWNPGDSAYELSPIDKIHQEITITLPHRGHYEYKFARGTWATVESTSAGIDISNRSIDVKNDTVIHIKIAGWIDDYKDLAALPDSVKYEVLNTRSYYYRNRNLDSSYKYALESYRLAEKDNYKWGEGFSMGLMGEAMEGKGNNAKALQFYLRESEISKQINETGNLLFAWNGLGQVFLDEKNMEQAKLYFYKVINMPGNYPYLQAQKSKAFTNLGTIYLNTGQLDSALLFAERGSKSIIGEINDYFTGTPLLLLGDIRKKMGMDSLSLNYYHQAIEAGFEDNNLNDVANGYQRIAEDFKEKKQPDSGFYYSKKAFNLARQIKNTQTIYNAGSLLVNFYEKKNELDSAFIYQQTVLQAKDSLFNLDKQREIQSFVFNQQLDQQKTEARQTQYRNRAKMYALLGGLVALIIIAIILLLNSKHRQKLYALLLKKKKEAEDTLAELKSTQKQLIQSEKMASLGELTAGIAHEIQNPLNFVNNFSEVNRELIVEMRGELAKGNAQLATDIANDIDENEEKIIHHGKRADAIVKSMLQHSRTSSGKKELTNINALADEYFRLSYHGMRAKDKEFNVTMKTDFDESIGRINVVPQDIGRVLLNLFNNAFYAAPLPPEGGFKDTVHKHEPTVWVSTKRIADVIPPLGGTRGAGAAFVEIRVRDNGNGIPEKIKDKIFQPFFTTKPTGEGTGLGLSLSYDMIKAHGGEISVNSKEGEGTEFVVVLPA